MKIKTPTQILRLFQQKITGFSKSQLFLHSDFSSAQKANIHKYVQRYELWEPLEYIIESAIFYGYDFFVDARVLIPRNDTEVLVDRVLQSNFKHLIDIGSGSWAIGIAVAKEKKLNSLTLIDLHTSALAVARINLKNHSIPASVIQSDLLEKIKNIKPFTVITANLPYIRNNDFDNLDQATQIFEPSSALYGWPKTGFELYERLIDQIMTKKKENKTILFIEIWFDQAKYSREYLSSKHLDFEVFKDNSGIDRCIRIMFS